MADVCDLADEHMEAEARQRALLAAERAKVRELHPNGFCHNPACGMDLVDDDGQPSNTRLFCDSTCSSKFESAKRAGKVPRSS